MAHLTMGPQATLALFTFSKLNSGLFRYFVFILFRMSSLQPSYVTSSVQKLTMVWMKFSPKSTPRMALQSGAGSPRSRQIASSVVLTGNGGLPMLRTSTKCCRFMPCTAAQGQHPLPQHRAPSAMTLCLFSAITSSCF
ncbi:unnamed protein product [Ixodes pacificus]